MCSYKTLHHCEQGYVLRCLHCQHLHVGFGTTVQAFTRDQFYEFKAVVEEQYALHRSDRERNRKQVYIATAAKAVTLIYSLRDLERLTELLEKADERLSIEKLFVFHDN
jgi:hypothetical protein